VVVVILPWSKLGRISFQVLLHWWSGSCRLEKVGQCNMLMEKVSAAFSVLIIPFIPGMWRIHG
jgi:hypothetical protein